MRGRGVVRRSKGITLVISNEDMDDIIRFIESLQNSGVLIDGVSATLNMKLKKQKGAYLGILLENINVSVLVNMLTGKDLMIVARRYNNMHKKLQFLSIL